VIAVTVLRPAARDSHGDPVGEPAQHQVRDVVVAPRAASRSGSGSGEDTSDGETVIVGLAIYAPFDADIKATDQVRIDEPAWAGTYDVVGEPGRWQSPPSGRKIGLEVALTRTGTL
jgi:hypothetical protein